MSVRYDEAGERLTQLRRRIAELRAEMRNVQRASEPQPVKDYEFRTASQRSVRLSELFGAQEYLFVIHNMGAGCPYCTLWADGFNGVLEHLQSRAAFVVSSPDPPDRQQAFASSRGWKFRMVSHAGTTFAQDMGFGREGNWMPGVSVFRRRGAQIVRVSDTAFSPGDDFCNVWHFFDLLPDGPAGWDPKYHYSG